MNWKNGLLHPYGCLSIRPSVLQHEKNLLNWMNFMKHVASTFGRSVEKIQQLLKPDKNIRHVAFKPMYIHHKYYSIILKVRHLYALSLFPNLT